MNWSKSKTIFILLFLVIDLALAGYLAFDLIGERWISQETVEQTVRYLENHQIHLDASLLPRWTPTVRNLEFINVLDTDGAFLQQFAPENIDGAQKLEKGGKTLSIEENYFIYEDAAAGIFHAAPEKAAENAKAYLSQIGFDLQTAESRIAEQSAECVKIQFTQAAEGLAVDDISVTVSLEASGALRAEGMWLNPSERSNEYEKAAVRPVIGALIEFSREVDREVTITDISVSYRAGETEVYHKTLTAVAFWRIQTQDGGCYYFNARG